MADTIVISTANPNDITLEDGRDTGLKKYLRDGASNRICS